MAKKLKSKKDTQVVKTKWGKIKCWKKKVKVKNRYKTVRTERIYCSRVK